MGWFVSLDLVTKIFVAGFALYVLFHLWPVLFSFVLWVHARLVTDPVPVCPAPAGVGQHEFQDLSDALEPLRRRYKLPALAACAIRDGKVVALGTVGVRRAGHAEPVLVHDRFHLGSCTKAMTATVCALLVEQKRLRWYSTIAEIFPDLADGLAEGYRPVTLEQLLTHRSGLAEGFSFTTTLWPKVWELNGPLPEQRLALLKLVFEAAPGSPPGRAFQYSNCGYAIAGAMCERVTGRSWEELMREMVFEPLGMTSAGFGPPGTPGQADQPWGHHLGFFSRRFRAFPPGPRESDNPRVIAPAGGVHCTLVDWAKFAAMHLTGERGQSTLLQPDTFRVLHSPTLGGDYAFGWLVAERDWAGGKALSHSGSNTMWFSVIWLAPNRNLALLAATNLGTNAGNTAVDQAVQRVMKVTENSPRQP